MSNRAFFLWEHEAGVGVELGDLGLTWFLHCDRLNIKIGDHAGGDGFEPYTEVLTFIDHTPVLLKLISRVMVLPLSVEIKTKPKGGAE